MRELTTHRITTGDTFNSLVRVEAYDPVPEQGGACQRYEFCVRVGNSWSPVGVIKFHQGVMKEFDGNGNPIIRHPTGISMEAVIAVLIDHLQGLQRGKFPCKENIQALCCLQDALDYMQERTKDRMTRGVSGEHKS